MTSTTTPSVEPAQPETAVSVGRTEAVERVESRNLLVLAWYHVALRLAWIFKTESVIVPAFLDTIVGTPGLRDTLRGCLPVLNRFGHSVPPLLYADRMRRAERKTSVLLRFTLLMAVPFLALSASCLLGLDESLPFFPVVFLALYALFFAATGLNNLAFGTVQGKLIRVDRRGRLMAIAGIVGSILAVSAAWFVMPAVLRQGSDGRLEGFGMIFLISGSGFVLSALFLLGVREPAVGGTSATNRENGFASAWRLVREDAKFRGLAVVAMLYMTIQLVFPHYQALGLLESSDSQGVRLATWVVVQNAGVGLFSPVVGAIADRAGNRLAFRILAFGSVIAPVLAIALNEQWLPGGPSVFWVVFLLLGLSPVGMRTLSNFVLEFCDESDHPRYLSTLKLCMAVPFLFSPLVGYLVGRVGFAPVFLGVAACVATAGLLTFTVHEPRHD